MKEPIKAPHNNKELALPAGAFTGLCVTIHEFNTQWWLDPRTGQPKDRNVGEMLMLAVSELAEGMEGHRKNLMDTHLPQYEMLDVELVDCIIRCCDLLGARYKHRVDNAQRGGPDDAPLNPSAVYTPGDILYDKCLYNSKRADHRPENRIKPDGKKY